MAKRKDYLPILLIMAGFSLLSVFGCLKSKGVGQRTSEHALFTIKAKTRTSSRFDVNTATRRRDTVTSYQVRFDGQPLPFPEGSTSDHLWKVYILADAPVPSLLTMGKSAYLWVEKEGQLTKIEIIAPGDDFLTLQQLGTSQESPDPQGTVYRSDDRKVSIELKGSKYLLIGQEQLLRISDLQLFPIPRKKRLVDDFYPHTANGAQGVSPDEQQLVLIGSKSDEVNRTQYHYGLMVYHLDAGENYVVQIDQNKTRLPDYQLIAPNWFTAYYEWKQQPDGAFRLVEKELSPLPPWQGWFKDPGDLRYSLNPVSLDVLSAFGEFVERQLSLSSGAIEKETTEHFQYLKFVYEEKRFTISYWAEGEQLGFSVDLLERGNAQTDEIVKFIGEAFNKELSKGEYQSYFTSL
ncbi:MAG: hypothetical protein KTR30_16010 [Saprospiraceae bacterium]|nr:hypothetical protein [Saprospiraceae bacterium]